jgi:hypothetical protein
LQEKNKVTIGGTLQKACFIEQLMMVVAWMMDEMVGEETLQEAVLLQEMTSRSLMAGVE